MLERWFVVMEKIVIGERKTSTLWLCTIPVEESLMGVTVNTGWRESSSRRKRADSRLQEMEDRVKQEMEERMRQERQSMNDYLVSYISTWQQQMQGYCSQLGLPLPPLQPPPPLQMPLLPQPMGTQGSSSRQQHMQSPGTNLHTPSPGGQDGGSN